MKNEATAQSQTRNLCSEANESKVIDMYFFPCCHAAGCFHFKRENHLSADWPRTSQRCCFIDLIEILAVYTANSKAVKDISKTLQYLISLFLLSRNNTRNGGWDDQSPWLLHNHRNKKVGEEYCMWCCRDLAHVWRALMNVYELKLVTDSTVAERISSRQAVIKQTALRDGSLTWKSMTEISKNLNNQLTLELSRNRGWWTRVCFPFSALAQSQATLKNLKTIIQDCWSKVQRV